MHRSSSSVAVPVVVVVISRQLPLASQTSTAVAAVIRSRYAAPGSSAPEHSAARDEQIRARLPDRTRSLPRWTPPSTCTATSRGRSLRRVGDPVERLGHELLTGEARMDAHAEHEVRTVGGRCGLLDGRFRVERHAHAEPELSGTRDRLRRLALGLDVERDAVAARRPDLLQVPLPAATPSGGSRSTPSCSWTRSEMDWSTIGPIVISSMKWPSPTSKWKIRASASRSARSCSPRREKSPA